MNATVTYDPTLCPQCAVGMPGHEPTRPAWWRVLLARAVAAARAAVLWLFTVDDALFAEWADEL